MNLNEFLQHFSSIAKLNHDTGENNLPDQQINDLFLNYGGLIIERGLFKIHNFSTSKKWTNIITDSYPQYRGKVICFGFDWLGRQFGKVINKDKILMFDISTHEDFSMEQQLEDFFNEELVSYSDETLSSENFKNWIINQEDLKFNEIAGFKIPLKLGGSDSLSNLERIDAEVDWEINRQLHN